MATTVDTPTAEPTVEQTRYSELITITSAAAITLIVLLSIRLGTSLTAPNLVAIDQLAYVPIIFVTLIASVGAYVTYAALRRYTTEHVRNYVIIATLVTLASFTPIVTIEFTLAQQLLLSIIHLVAAVTISIPVLGIYPEQDYGVTVKTESPPYKDEVFDNLEHELQE